MILLALALSLACSTTPPATDSGVTSGDGGTNADGGADGGAAGDGGASGDGGSTLDDAPTWYQDVAPIVGARCSGCHVRGGIAFDLMDVDTSTALAGSMAAAVENGTMPPWDAGETPDCAPERVFADDPRPTPEEQSILRDWADAGAPLGDADAPANVPTPETDSLDPVDDTLLAQTPWVIEGPDDQFMCFTVDPGNAFDMWLSGIEFLQGDPTVDHHALVYLDPRGESVMKAGEDGWYECFGGPGIAETEMIAAWAPGAPPARAPEGTGILVPGRSRLVVQMHFHPTADAHVDQSGVALQWLDAEPTGTYHISLLGNAGSANQGLMAGPNDDGDPEFRIPADVPDHTETMYYDLPTNMSDISVVGVGTHMHYIGAAGEVWVERSTPDEGESSEECMVAVPTYDYEWQRLYLYDDDLEHTLKLSGGDRIVVRCTYDNTTAHEGTRTALEDAGLDAPVDVYLGDETLDEMCLAVISWVN